MAVSKANQRAVAKYMKNNYDDIKVRVYKGQRDIIQKHAEAKGTTVNAIIKDAIRNVLESDGGDVSAWDALAPERDTQEVTQ